MQNELHIYTEAVNRIGSAIEYTAFFDDNINALTTAAMAGLYTVGVYDDSSADFTEQMNNTADLYIHSFSHITKK